MFGTILHSFTRSFKAGLHCDISISTSINISITNVHTCCISTRKLTYASAVSSRMKPRGYWTSYVFKMADEEEILLLLLLLRRRRRRREQKRVNRKRSCWVRDIFQKRKEQGDFHNLVQELQLADREFYFRYLWLANLLSLLFSLRVF